MSDQILKAGTVITMDPTRPHAQAVAVSVGRITAVDTGAAALLPGLIEPHSHPLMSGVALLPQRRISDSSAGSPTSPNWLPTRTRSTPHNWPTKPP